MLLFGKILRNYLNQCSLIKSVIFFQLLTSVSFIFRFLTKKQKWRPVVELETEDGMGATEGMEAIANGVATLVTTRSVSMVKNLNRLLGNNKKIGVLILSLQKI